MNKLKIITVCILWSLCYPFISIGLDQSPPLYFAFLRSIIAGALLLLLSINRSGSLVPKDWKTWSSIIIIGLGYTSFGFGGMFFAGNLVSPGLATVISNLQPMIAIGFAYILSVERIKSRQFVASLIGLVGIITIVLPSLTNDQANLTQGGIGFVLLGATGVAFGNVWLKKVANTYDILKISAWQFIIGSIPLGVLAFILEDSHSLIINNSFIISLSILSVLGTAVATFLWFRLLKDDQLHSMNAYTFMTPLFALFIGRVFLNEILEINEIIGTVIITAGIIFLNLRDKKNQIIFVVL